MSQLARKQRRLESKKGNRRQDTVEQPRTEERPSVGPEWKVVEAPRQTTGNRENLTNRNQEAGSGESQEDHPTPRTELEERTGRAPWENRRAGPHCEGGIEGLLDANPPGTGGTQTGAYQDR